MMNKKTFRVFAAWVVAAIVLSCGAAGVVKAFAAADPVHTDTLKPFFKHDYPADDFAPEQVTPNLLFFVETGNIMMFSMGGVMPVSGVVYNTSNNNQHKANMQRYNTFGFGMRLMFSGRGAGWQREILNAGQIISMDGGYKLVQVDGGYSRLGNDLDDTNNKIGNADCYYTSDPNKPYLLTLRHRLLAHHNWSGDLPPDWSSIPLWSATPVANTYNPTANEVAAAQNSYNAIKDYMPGGTFAGHSVPGNLANEHLVPNDSKMYQLKLVLWRLTEPTNAETFSKVNVAIARPHVGRQVMYKSWGHKQVGIVSPDASGNVRYAQLGERNYNGAWTSNAAVPGVAFPHGAGTNGILGLAQGGTMGVDYVGATPYSTLPSHMGQMNTSNVNGWSQNETGNNPNPTGATLLRGVSCAVMVSPFVKLYERNAIGGFTKNAQLDKLKEDIDGVETYPTSNGTGTRPSNDELADGMSDTATGIYGGRTGGNTARAVPDVTGAVLNGTYHQDKTHANGSVIQDLIQYATTSRTLYYGGNVYLGPINIPDDKGNTLKSGQVGGSVIDFFSPPISDTDAKGLVGQNGLTFNADTAGFFPVTNSCQQNWVVLFSSGNESLQGYKIPTGSTTYYSTAEAALKLFKNTFTMRGRHWNGSAWIERDHDMASGVRTIVVGVVDKDNPDAAELVGNLKETARYGDPILVGTDPGDPEHWAPRAASDPNVPKPFFVKNTAELLAALNAIMKRVTVGNMGSGSPVSLPQQDADNPDGSRTVLGASFKINDGNQWSARLNRTDFNRFGAQIISATTPWEANEKMRVEVSSHVSGANVRRLFTWKASNSIVANLAGNAEIHQEWKTIAGVPNMGAAQKFNTWLHEFDVKHPPEEPIGVLGDTQHSNILVVGKPLVGGILDRTRSIYLQTNRGFLHRIDYKTGAEKWAFVPPNIFEDRLKHLKFDDNFTDGNSSTPMFLLDGKLTANDVVVGWNLSNPSHKTILTGYLGRGGNGFYAMDITAAADGTAETPKFLWAIENAYYGTGTAGPSLVHKWGATATSGYDGYSKLGLTIVPGVLLTQKVAGDNGRSVGVLPGGLGHKMGKNGDTQGKILYFFDPNDGSILHHIDLTGMGITPVTYQEGTVAGGLNSKLRHTDSFYTADSDGNIMFFDMKDLIGYNLTSVAKEQVFRLTTTETDVSARTPVVIPYAMTAARSEKDHRWLFGGTANIPGPYSSSLVSDDKTLMNKEQLIFGLNLKHVVPANSMTDLSNLTYYSDGIIPAYPTPAVSFAPPPPTSADLVDHTTKGWYLKLRPALDASGRSTAPEYVSAPPFLFNGYLYVATFIPYTNEVTCVDADIGVGKLYMLSPTTGLPINAVPAIVMQNVKIVGFSGVGNYLDMSVQELKTGAIVAAKTDLENGGVKDVNLGLAESGILTGTPPAIPATPPDIPSGPAYIQYWREIFN